MNSQVGMLADIRAERQREQELQARRPSALPVLDMRSPVAGHWSCRNTDCRKPVEITEEAQDNFALLNRELRKRKELPLNTADIVFCKDCEKIVSVRRMRKQAERAARVTEAIRELKQGAIGARKDFLVAQLKTDHHPDVPGLLEAIEARKSTSKTTVRKRSF